MNAKQKYSIYRADSSDNEGQNVAHSHMVSVSADQHRQLIEPSSPMKLRPESIQDNEQTEFIMHNWEPTLDIRADWSWGEDERGERDSQDIIVNPLVKRSTASDALLREWMGYDGRASYREEFLLEDLRLEGHGDAGLLACSCGRLDESNYPISSLFRCEECFGRDMLCQECCLDCHKRLPLHVININIGLRVQLGHSDMTCACPVGGHTEFLVLHVNGIHRVNVDFCGCDWRVSHRQQLMRCDWFPSTVHQPQTACTCRLLEHFLLLTWSSKISAFEYYQTLERLTDNTGIFVPKSHYSAFLRMIREYRHMLLLKRSGRGHVENGISNLQPGELALHCPACPQPGVNLPRGWETVDPSMKIRSSDLADPGMHTGLAYFVANEPYNAHVLQFASQKDVSTCSGFSTLAHAESKFSNGLWARGIGLCLCARHEFVCPKGVGDLQKGEHFCNMDFNFFSAIIPLLLLNVVISYNVACQWKINLLNRMNRLPQNMHIPVVFATTAFMFGIPKFHASAHDDCCTIPHSLNLMPGVGQTDGEGIERNWAEINRVANSTKEMGPGARHDTLDDHFGHHNWHKFVGLGLSLRKKLIIAVKERDRQQAAFQEFNLAVGTSYQNQWTAMVKSWEEDKTQPNPFTTRERGISEADVRAHFAEFHRHNMSPSVFVTWGLSLEDCQRRLRFDIIGGALSSSQQTELQRRRTALLKQIHRFRSVQATYTVDLENLLEQNDDGSLVEAENIILWLPSRISASIRTVHLIKHRNRDAHGQRANTRAASVISRLDDKIKMIAEKYHTTWPDAWENELRPLDAHDVWGPSEDVGSIENPSDIVGADGRKRTRKQSAAAIRRLGQGFMRVSWIWTSVGVLEDNDDINLNDALCVEWVKARARALRWNEEVLLLKEEMWRTRAYLEWKARWWDIRAEFAASTSQLIVDEDRDVFIDAETDQDDAEDDMED
ncbi:uncharacterized protein F5147DRAFT_745615 [Suillus discolor]|uniref:CxC2-like cysteine cluster KDZ transposase-associated domain-containing protein n=1 Tax=Suillus discolor TaxID=1912936 RepID=A0A9P7F830_9AGAM|nr:uncharacterized protein F5147DRAFT_745615 [Suillus discolor]KAG2108890.1 hypothetical protein F5147DRAFT_745615 [Suillus discolor]